MIPDMNPFHRRTSCCLCNAHALTSVCELTRVPYASPNVGNAAALLAAGGDDVMVPLELFLCGACGHLQLADIVNPEIQYRNYRYRTSISLGLPEHFRALARALADGLSLKPGAKLLEIGSNDGTLLQALKELGFSVVGVEPSPAAAQAAQARGVDTVHDFFSAATAQTIKSAQGCFDAICANYVFANIESVGDFVEGMRTLLSDDGVFIFETQYGRDVVERFLIDTIYHEHISYFLIAPLVALFARHEMGVFKVERIATKGGSIRVYVQKTGGRRPVDVRVTDLLAEESRMAYSRPDAYAAFSQRVTNHRDEIKAMLAVLEGTGKRVAGYGASVGSLTLLHFYGLASKLDVIYDDSPMQDTLSTGTGEVAVRDSGDRYEGRAPDVLFLFAWRYADPIRSRHARFLDGGGKFLVPLPTPRWIT
jgi:ubiquinone/menaquinone biosynthesis C-methylase UbiE